MIYFVDETIEGEKYRAHLFKGQVIAFESKDEKSRPAYVAPDLPVFNHPVVPDVHSIMSSVLTGIQMICTTVLTKERVQLCACGHIIIVRGKR